MIPITRKELYLNKIVGNDDYSVPEKPISEEEFFFAEILGEAVQAPEPLTRYQMYLAKIAGREIEIPYPEVRLEYFLARAAGMEIEAPTPITREEMFWADYALIVEKELSGIPPLTFNAVAGTLKNYRIYGNTVNGESVGDRTANLIQGSIKNANIGNNGKINTSNEFILVYAPVVTGESYTINNNNGTNVYAFYNVVPSTETETSYDNTRQIFSTSTITFVSPTTGYIAVRLANAAQDIMINPGSTAVPYEPVGYRVPVTVEGKNLLQNTASSQTKNGVTFTVNNDGSVTCNGTASNNTFFKIGDLSLASQSYILTGCPSDGGKDSYTLRCYKNGNIKGTDVGNGFNINESIDGYIEIRIASGYTCDNLTFYPMICKANIEDNTYEPYHDPINTNIYLPEQIKMVGDEAEYIDFGQQKQHRVRKNLWSGVVEQGSVSTLGEYANDSSRIRSKNILLSPGIYTISCNLGIRCIYAYSNSEKVSLVVDNGGGAVYRNTFTIPSGANNVSVSLRAFDASGTAINNVTPSDFIWGQIEKGSEVTTYEPFIENTEVDVTLPALQTLSGTNTLTVGTEVQPSKVYLKGKIEEIPTRTVSYYSQDGSTLLGTETVESGGNASGLQGTPTKPDTEQYTYTFVGWSNTTNATTAMSGILNNITADKSVYAAFSETEKTFEVDFYNGDTLLETAQNVAYNGTATYTGSTPTKASTAQYDYIFAGWTKTQGSTTVDADALTGVTADRNVYAVFTATARSYTVTFMNVSTLMDTQTVTYGGTAVYGGTTPTKAETSEYTYTFAGWNTNSSASTADADALTNVTADRTVYAIFTAVSKGYTVYFYNGETLLETVTGVPSGGTATYTGATPTSSQAGYIFSGWSPSNTNITADTSCYAQFVDEEMYESISDTWSEIIANVSNGTYSTKYQVGDTKKIDLGTEGEVIMTIVGIDADDLADDSGKAPITWISKQLLKTYHRMNPAKQSGTSGTGTFGGWEKSEMRSYLKETIKPLLPSEVRNALKTVKKYSRIYNTSGTAVNNVVSNDDIWIPSAYEVNFSGHETSGVTYSSAFPDNASRIKHKVGDSAAVWWLRTANTASNFRTISSSGSVSTYGAVNSHGVAVGFVI